MYLCLKSRVVEFLFSLYKQAFIDVVHQPLVIYKSIGYEYLTLSQ